MLARPIHRYISFLIDLLVTGAISFLVAYPAIIALLEAHVTPNRSNVWNLFYISMLCGAIVTILAIAYFLVLPLFWKRQTVGRYLTRIAIVKDDGEPVDFQTLFVREVICRMLASLMSFGLAIIADGFLLANGHRKSFSDAIARTKVIDV